jgi:hypothetical protein
MSLPGEGEPVAFPQSREEMNAHILMDVVSALLLQQWRKQIWASIGSRFLQHGVPVTRVYCIALRGQTGVLVTGTSALPSSVRLWC